jgi:ribonuclease Z
MNYEIKWRFTKNDGLDLLFEDEKVLVYSFPMKHRIFCTGFLFKEKPLLRKIDKDKLDKNKISTAEINNLRRGQDVMNEEGRKVRNKDVTIDPEMARSFAYCSDTIYDEDLLKYIKGVDTLYHESTFLNDKATRATETFHSTAEQAAKIAKAAKVKQLLLGHYSARYGDLEPFIQEASPFFKNVLLATEGKKFKI